MSSNHLKKNGHKIIGTENFPRKVLHFKGKERIFWTGKNDQVLLKRRKARPAMFDVRGNGVMSTNLQLL